VGRSAQAWIDAWAAGAPVTKLNAIKANRDVEDEKEKHDPDVSNESEDEPLPEVTTKAPPSFDLGDMDLAESTPGGAKRINVDPNERDYPDSVFVSDDEADQEAMEDVLGVKPKNYSLSDITNMAEKRATRRRRPRPNARRFSTSTARSRNPTSCFNTSRGGCPR
jgi:hypothetical protein